MEIFILSNWDILLRLLIALVLSGLMGVERTMAGKMAGLRTYALVGLGSTLFIIISISVASATYNIEGFNFDPLRVAAQVVLGVGFLGGGLIIFHESGLHGLTTAAGLWVAAGVGVACGFGLYLPAILATFFSVFIFNILWLLEEKFLKKDFFKSYKSMNNG